MADIKWPDDLPGPQISTYSMEEAAGFTESQLNAGPAFITPITEDMPQFHNVTYIFKRGHARKFEQFLRENKIRFLSPWFDGPIIRPNRNDTIQECRYTQDGVPQLTGVSGNLFTYSARLITRSLVLDDMDYETEMDASWSVNFGNIDPFNAALDEGLNDAD